ncbi:MAG: prephenate dehydrogenase [Caldicoprobacterales bacterium]
MIFSRICIVGLGLIGGSLAKAIRRSHPKCFIVAIDSDRESLETALADNIADSVTLDLADGVRDADLVFLCTPVHTMTSIINEVMPLLNKDTLITDVASTKQNIMEVAQQVHASGQSKALFIGGHPMAGTQYSGYHASLAHLFENAYYVLTPLDSTPAWALNSLSEFLSSIGALPLVMDGKTHDKIIGAVSHLPHVVAAALVNTVKDIDDSSHLCEKLAAGGFRDITRIASSNPEMWKNISLANKKELISLIGYIIEYLTDFRALLEKEETSNIEEFFNSAKIYRENLPVRQVLNLLPYYDLYVDVEDRPGVIGEVTTILGKHSINIKNLRIINSREGEPGSLVISFLDKASLEKAQRVLSKGNYRTFTQN